MTEEEKKQHDIDRDAWFGWLAHDGPLNCPHCNTPTELRDMRTLHGGLSSSKGGGKASWSEKRERFCPKCFARVEQESKANRTAGRWYDLEDMIRELETGEKALMDCEKHPEKYKKESQQ